MSEYRELRNRKKYRAEYYEDSSQLDYDRKEYMKMKEFYMNPYVNDPKKK